MKKIIINLIFGLALFLMSTTYTTAQRESGDFGIGGQLGSPTGLSIQLYKSAGASPDFLFAWDLNDFLYVNGHALFQPHIGNSGNLHFIYGPGAFVGVYNQGIFKDKVEAGISGTVGLSLLISKFEIYGRITPRLSLLERTQADVGGGLGLRFYL